MSVQAAFFGLAGTEVSADERAFFKAVQPAGFILFARNCASPAQVKALCDDLRSLCSIQPAPILIDQEGGRVARLRPPHWLDHPPAAVIGQLYAQDPAKGLAAANAQAALIGAELAHLGITVDCLPVLDVGFAHTHAVIGDRAYSSDPDKVAMLGQAAIDGLQSAGVVPVIKHIPGHGRAMADSHLDLPVVDAPRDELAAIDFAPFVAARAAPMAMTAHILYTALDKHNCATLSPHIIGDIIRKHIGFEGLLMTDDLSMKALGGGFSERTEKALAAGCDIVLHCNGDMAEMEDVAHGLSALSSEAMVRLDRAMQIAAHSDTLDIPSLLARRNALLEDVWTA